MMVDLTLSELHIVLIFVLIGVLGAEAGLVQKRMDGMRANRVTVLDRSYGAAAGFLLVVGFVRVFYGAKGVDSTCRIRCSVPRSRPSRWPCRSGPPSSSFRGSLAHVSSPASGRRQPMCVACGA